MIEQRKMILRSKFNLSGIVLASSLLTNTERKRKKEKKLEGKKTVAAEEAEKIDAEIKKLLWMVTL